MQGLTSGTSNKSRRFQILEGDGYKYSTNISSNDRGMLICNNELFDNAECARPDSQGRTSMKT